MRTARRRRPLRRERSTWAAAVILGGAALFGLYALGRNEPLPPFEPEARIPRVAYEAYVGASEAAATVAPDCAVDWTVIAGIAQVESAHGQLNGATIDPAGAVSPPIRGLTLDGTGGTRAVEDSDDGELDGDPDWDRAMGPLQFIPSSWSDHGRDANGDGLASPDNIFDAALSAVAHLCERSPGDFSDPGDLRRALLSYNESQRYADEVLGFIERYRTEPLADVVASPPPGADG